MLDIVGVVFARGGSKGVRRKNLRLFLGQPLVARAVEAGMMSPSITRVVVSTDDEEIARAAEAAGAEVPFMRPAELATDDAPEWLAWQHAVRELAAGGPLDLLVSLPPVAPLRTVDDVERCIAVALEPGVDLALTVTPCAHNPYFSVVSVNEHGGVRLAIDGPRVHRRQDAPQLFDITPIAYAVRPAYILASTSMFDGVVRAVEVAREHAIDIDTEFDLQVARSLATTRAHYGRVGLINDMDLGGRVSLVVGGAGPTGRVVCDTLASLGSSVIVLDLEGSGCDTVAASLGSTHGVPCMGVEANVSDERVSSQVVSDLLDRFGRLDVLANCMPLCTILHEQAMGSVEGQHCTGQLTHDAALSMAFHMMQAASPALAASPHGSVIHIGSLDTSNATALQSPSDTVGTTSADALTRGDLAQLTHWAAGSLAPSVRVNAISPGSIIDTFPSTIAARQSIRTPVKPNADDLRGVVAFLATDLSLHTTGQSISVDSEWYRS